MRVEDEINVDAPHSSALSRLSDALFFALFIDGVSELTEIRPTRHSAFTIDPEICATARLMGKPSRRSKRALAATRPHQPADSQQQGRREPAAIQ